MANLIKRAFAAIKTFVTSEPAPYWTDYMRQRS
jgi:hypothetical protein